MVYAAGSFRPAGSGVIFTANPKLTRLYLTQRHKIEALALWPGEGGGLVPGSDDESFGGSLSAGW